MYLTKVSFLPKYRQDYAIAKRCSMRKKQVILDGDYESDAVIA